MLRDFSLFSLTKVFLRFCAYTFCSLVIYFAAFVPLIHIIFSYVLECSDGSTLINDDYYCASRFNYAEGCSDSSCDGRTRCNLARAAYTANPSFTSSTALCQSKVSQTAFSPSSVLGFNYDLVCQKCCNFRDECSGRTYTCA